MPKHRAPRRKIGPITAVLFLTTLGLLTGRQVDLPDSGTAIDRVSDVADQEDVAGGAGDTEAEYPGTGPEDASGIQPSKQVAAAAGRLKAACGPNVVEERFTVASLNIESAQSGLDEVTAAVADLDADIVLLQEVDRFRATSRYADQPGDIGKRLGMYSAFGANVLGGSNQYGRSQSGTAILSKYRIKEEWTTLLPNDRRGTQRGLQHAVLDVKGLELSVYNTHLQSTNDRLKMRQIRAIAPVLAADDRPRLFGGDLDAQPGSPVLGVANSVLEDPWAAGVGRGSAVTDPTSRPRARVDYVLHQGEGLVPLRADVVPPGVSGHRPTRATYTLTPAAGAVTPGSPRAAACR